jgi:hypothetical protein
MSADPTRNPHAGESVKDWYEALGLTSDADLRDIDVAIERKSRQASAIANTAPDRSQQIRDMIRAIRSDLLSGVDKRHEYDERLTRARLSAAAPSPLPPTRNVEPVPTPTGPTPADESRVPPSPTVNVPSGEVGRLASRFRQFLQSGWTCPSCHAEGMPEDKFCKTCGATMKPETSNSKTRCSNCSAEFGVNDKFCSRCGATAP